MADGTRIEVFANLGSLKDAAKAVEQGAEGCGLLRTEFLFLNRATAPSEAEQAADYAAIASALEGRPLIVRLLDIGGDKPAPYLPIAPEENPALGLRGIRVALARRDILVAQLRAILRAAPLGDLRIMAPMIARWRNCRPYAPRFRPRRRLWRRHAAARRDGGDARRRRDGRCFGRAMRFSLDRHQ
jgi:phosphocarrier protein FPr/phosphocarrier protein